MRRKPVVHAGAGALVLVCLLTGAGPAQQQEVIPHGQDRPPNPPLSPQEAIKKMVVPAGFHVELVAAEPKLVNPVAMTFDERGRIWITESLEYPRQPAGPGRDRIKILESTRGDGRFDKVTIFAEGLNIPSGIAVGHGGVWVANSPDILFYKIGRDGRAAGKPEVVVTGFGRDDTHELPNSLTWGPDGWLYGLNGVFNQSRVKHRGKQLDFTCAMFRIHPRTRAFELFAEGTSNPWGIAYDPEGSAFVSACVIDHLWHLAQTGYYVRQGGPYPPYTWPISSIVRHRHQKAAYCGLHYFDSDAYPPEYRGKLYMGNIHGNCVNCDELTRDGSTYFARPRPDFLTANDAWFMPVAQRTGPDGCLYVLDWYDRYHCYQDAGRDPKGIDRERGRLYRVVYKDYQPAGTFDLGAASDDQLLKHLGSPNIYFRDTAQRLLTERLGEGSRPCRSNLEGLVLSPDGPRTRRMHALWALVGSGRLEPKFHRQLLAHEDRSCRAWGVRAAANQGNVLADIREQVVRLAGDPAPEVKLQVAIAARRLPGVDPLPVLLRVLNGCGQDRLIPHIVWQNLHPLLEERPADFLRLAAREVGPRSNLARLLPRIIERLLDSPQVDPGAVVSLLGDLRRPGAAETATCLELLAAKVETGEIRGARLTALRDRLGPILQPFVAGTVEGGPGDAARMLAAALKNEAAFAPVRASVLRADESPPRRLHALKALIAGGDPFVLPTAARVLADSKADLAFRGQVLAALGRLPSPEVGRVVLAAYPRLEGDLKARAIELLTQRPEWGKQLLAAVSQKKVSADALNINQVRRLLASKDPVLAKQVRAHWGTLRDERNPRRERVVAQMRELLAKGRGSPAAGWKVFKNVCGQCHKIYGEGVEVGPDLTSNGRASFDQLLSNVFDPSLVIGAGYQATTVVTTRGQIVTGLVAEDSARRIVLKTQGGKLETIPRDEVEEVHVSDVSLMPEELEKQLGPQEIRDLFAFLTLDRPPGDPKARLIPGTPR